PNFPQTAQLLSRNTAGTAVNNVPHLLASLRLTEKLTKTNAGPVNKIATTQELKIKKLKIYAADANPSPVLHWKCRVGVKPHREFESRPLRFCRSSHAPASVERPILRPGGPPPGRRRPAPHRNPLCAGLPAAASLPRTRLL